MLVMPKTNIFESARIVISKYSVIKPHLAFRESSDEKEPSDFIKWKNFF